MITSARHCGPRRASTNGRLLKAAGAAIGAAVVVGMGAFTDSAAIATGPEAGPQTITQTAPPPEPETPFARPTMTAPRFGGWCSFCSSEAALP